MVNNHYRSSGGQRHTIQIGMQKKCIGTEQERALMGNKISMSFNQI